MIYLIVIRIVNKHDTRMHMNTEIFRKIVNRINLNKRKLEYLKSNYYTTPGCIHYFESSEIVETLYHCNKL